MIEKKIFLIRHGETKWSLSGQHTGSTDIPLTEKGEVGARALAPAMQKIPFVKAYVSPLQRARKTFELMDLKAPYEIDEDLLEWNYGSYEGLTTPEIHKMNPSWSIFQDGAPKGESLEEIKERAERVLKKIASVDGLVAVFSSGHFLRALTAVWLGLPIEFGEHIALDTCSTSILGYEHKKPAIVLWNGKEP